MHSCSAPTWLLEPSGVHVLDPGYTSHSEEERQRPPRAWPISWASPQLPESSEWAAGLQGGGRMLQWADGSETGIGGCIAL